MREARQFSEARGIKELELKMMLDARSELPRVRSETQGVKVERRRIALDEPIKALGESSVGVRVHPEVVAQLLVARRRTDPLGALSPRERDVLALMAEGRSNAAIAERLVVTGGAVEKHVSNIFAKIKLPDVGSDNRRVLAVLAWLRAR